MLRPKFRFYIDIPFYIKQYCDDQLDCPGRDIIEDDDDFYCGTEKVEDSEVEKLLPREYWRTGMYLFPHLKTKETKREKRKGMFGFSEYLGVFHYREMWVISEFLEDEQERLSLNQPSQKEWEFLKSVPNRYLNAYYTSYRDYWYCFYQKHGYKYETRLTIHKFLKQLPNEDSLLQ